MEVGISVQHRDPWQNIAQVLDSKANLVTYCHEVQKKLGMRYVAPTVPIELVDSRNHDIPSLLEKNDHQTKEVETSIEPNKEEAMDEQAKEDLQFQQFRSMARTKYNIRMV